MPFHTYTRIVRREVGLLCIIGLLWCSHALAEAPEISISVDRDSINQLLCHLRGATFANTWDELVFRPTVSLHIETAEVATMHHHNETIDLHLKGNIQLHFYILETEQQSSVEFTADMQTRPISTDTAILLQVMDANVTLDTPIPSDDIELFHIHDLPHTVLFPKFIPLLDMKDLRSISIPLPGKTPVTVRPITPRILIGNNQLTFVTSLDIEPTP